MMVVIITGTPGTGKTALAKELSTRLNYSYLDPFKAFKGELAEGYDKIRRTSIVDVKKLEKLLVCFINLSKAKGLVIDSHLSHFLPSKYADICIVTKCGLKVLKKRLEKRGYSKSKVRENMDAEIFDICLNEAIELGHKPIIIDTTKKTSKSATKKVIDQIVKHQKLKSAF